MSKATRWLRALLLALGVGVLAAPALHAADKPLRPIKEWSGSFQEKEKEGLEKRGPTISLVASEADWDKLWKDWRGKEDVPKIDFARQLVLVGTTAGAPNKIAANFTLNDRGELRGGFTSTGVAGPGFVYRIVVLDREGIKTYNGKPIGKE